MNDNPLKTGVYIAVILIFWTVLLGSSLFWNLHVQEEEIHEAARIEARTSVRKDIIYRYWSAMHGGVYVPVDEHTPPNPYLENMPHRDFTTDDGRELTLVNPAYMTRQVHEIGREFFDVEGHITSLDPIRPENAADSWESAALQSFDQGAEEYSSVESVRGMPHLRLMIPLVTQDQCLRCHAAQGYQVGDIRGGISVAIPLTPIREIARSNIIAILAGHSIVWIIGIGGILVGGRIMKQRLQEQQRANLEEQKRYTALTLAATIAHEFNNPLAVIQGSVDLMREQERTPSEKNVCQDRVERQVLRMKELVDQLFKLEHLEEIDYAAGMKILNLHPPGTDKSDQSQN